MESSRKKKLARILLLGISGAGKTFTALRLARGLVGPEGRIAVVDTENAAHLYEGEEYEHGAYEYECLDPPFGPLELAAAIQKAAQAADVVILDSLSDEWDGPGGALEQVDAAAARSRASDSFGAGWRTVTPLHNRLLHVLRYVPIHVIATVKLKDKYAMERGPDGKVAPKKVGLGPIQRSGILYHFDLAFRLHEEDGARSLTVEKSRLYPFSKIHVRDPGVDLGAAIGAFLSQGKAADLPALGQAFTLDGKIIHTAGITQEQYVPLFEKLVKLERAAKGSAGSLLKRVTGKESLRDCTTADAAALEDALATPDVVIP